MNWTKKRLRTGDFSESQGLPIQSRNMRSLTFRLLQDEEKKSSQAEDGDAILPPSVLVNRVSRDPCYKTFLPQQTKAVIYFMA